MDLERIKNIHRMYQNKAYVDAEIGIRNLLKEAPNNSDVLRLGALTALRLNQVVTAQSRHMKAAQFCKTTAEMENTLGNILKAAGEWSQAEEAYKRSIILDSTYEPVRSNLIALFLISGQVKRAEVEIKRQEELYGVNDFFMFARASALIEMGRYDDALNYTDKISKSYNLEELSKLRVKLYFYLGRYGDMRKALESIPETSMHAKDSLAIAVNAYAMQGDWIQAHEAIKFFCEKPNALPQILVKSIELLDRGGFTDDAKSLRNDAQSRFNGHVDILSEKAKYFSNQGHYSDSCALYKEALSKRPGDFTLITNYARSCLSAGQFDLCQQLIQSAFQQAPNSQLLFAMAAALQRKRGGHYQTLYDYDNFIQVYDLLPPDGYQTVEGFNLELKKTLEEYHNFKSEPLNQSLRHGIQTDKDLSLIDDPVLNSFFKMIDKPILDYMKKIGYDPQHPMKRRNTNQYRINGAWSVQLSPQGHHVNHIHPMGWLSSSYYVDVPDVARGSEDREGWIKFGEPDIQGLNLEAEKYIEPKGGRLVLFPSYMWHGTIPFSGNQTRLTLPFDVVPV